MIIKYVSNYRDGTGWAKASTFNMLALSHAGFTVVPEKVKYNEVDQLLHSDILKLEENTSKDFDILINHILPTDYKYSTTDKKNYGFVALESNTLENIFWLKKIKLMDNMLVPNTGSQQCLKRYNINSNIFPHSFDFNYINSSQKTIEINQLKNSFNFVFIGEFSKRKNLESLIVAFHKEFETFENVNLVIKTSDDNVKSFINEVKKRLKLRRKYKEEIVITQRLSDNDLYSIMRQCHINVMPSYGEAWGYPILEGMALGLIPIYTQGIGVDDYTDPSFSLSVKSREVMCYGTTDTFEDLYTGNDTWNEIDLFDLQLKMRTAYNIFKDNPRKYVDMRNEAINKSLEYDYRAISKQLVNLFGE